MPLYTVFVFRVPLWGRTALIGGASPTLQILVYLVYLVVQNPYLDARSSWNR